MEAVDENATGSVYSVPSSPLTACPEEPWLRSGFVVSSPTRPSTGACLLQNAGAWVVHRVSVRFRRSPAGTATTQPVQERPLNSRLLLFECLLNPSILEHLTPRSQEVVREQQDRLGGGAHFWAFVLDKACRPFPKLRNLPIVKHEEPSAADSTT